MDSKKIIKVLKKNGYTLKATKGSHTQYENKQTGKKVTVPHPKKDLPLGTVISIEKQSGLRLRP